MERIRPIKNYHLIGNKIKWNHEPYDILPECCEKRLRVIFEQLLPDIISDIANNRKSEYEISYRMEYIGKLREMSKELLEYQDKYCDGDIIDNFVDTYDKIYNILKG